jgi:hypothetical protein
LASLVSTLARLSNLRPAAQSLEPTFQTFGALLSNALDARRTPEIDHLVDSLPVMLAQHGHSYRARVGREVADIGYCAAKKTRFHGVRLHCIAQRRMGRLPLPSQVWLCAASHHDSKAFIGQQPEIATTELFGDLAYPTPEIINHLKEQLSRLIAPQKSRKAKSYQMPKPITTSWCDASGSPLKVSLTGYRRNTDSKSK